MTYATDTELDEPRRAQHDHDEAVALLEELASCLGLSMDLVRDVAEKATERRWDELDGDDAEAVASLLSEALDRTLAKQAAQAA